jgi:hypothetical protein
MGFHQIDDVPQVWLAHLIDRSSYFNGRGTTVSTRYQLYPIRTQRPADGTKQGAVHCGTCGHDVQVTVPSASLALRTQRFWLVPAVILGAAIAFAIGWLFVRGFGHYSFAFFLVVILILVVFLGPFFSLLRRARTSHGVTVVRRQPGKLSVTHSIRIPTVPVEGAKVRYARARAERRRNKK